MTPWTAACQAPLSFTISESLLKFISIELVVLSNLSPSTDPFSFCPQSFLASGYFPMTQLFIKYWSGQSIGVSASASIFPVNIQGWFPLGLTCLISLKSKGASRVFFRTTVQKHQFFWRPLSDKICYEGREIILSWWERGKQVSSMWRVFTCSLIAPRMPRYP